MRGKNSFQEFRGHKKERVAVSGMVNIRGLTRIKMRLSLNRLCNTKLTGEGAGVGLALALPCHCTVGMEWFVLKYLL